MSHTDARYRFEEISPPVNYSFQHCLTSACCLTPSLWNKPLSFSEHYVLAVVLGINLKWATTKYGLPHNCFIKYFEIIWWYCTTLWRWRGSNLFEKQETFKPSWQTQNNSQLSNEACPNTWLPGHSLLSNSSSIWNYHLKGKVTHNIFNMK